MQNIVNMIYLQKILDNNLNKTWQMGHDLKDFADVCRLFLATYEKRYNHHDRNDYTECWQIRLSWQEYV